MAKRLLLVPVFVFLFAGVADAQYPILDMIANNVVQKYQQSTCEQLWEARMKPKTEQQQEFIQLLKSDPQMRTLFINKVAGPVVNKMFECGMVP